MAPSVEELWKSARDEEIIKAVGRWESTNETAQRVLIAEIRRRGLSIAVPEPTATPAQAKPEAPNPFTGKTLLLIIVILATIGALAVLVG